LIDIKIIRSDLFQKFPEIVFGFSTKIGLNRTAPFYFNLSFTVGDDDETVKQNREAFFNLLGLDSSQVAIQKQIHSDIITIVEKSGLIGESDAMITTRRGIGLAISSADCTPIFIYDRRLKVIAAVHSGWRGTEKRIVEKTLIALHEKYYSHPNDLFVYIGPSINQKNYMIGEEVAEKFDSKYLMDLSGNLYLDVLSANIDMILNCGIRSSNIEISTLCSYSEKEILHSYRRDGKLSGRSLGVIALK
jgi:YfiH family protein